MEASQNPNSTTRTQMYPQVIDSSPSAPPIYNSDPSPNQSNLYPTLDMKDLVENLFPDTPPPLNDRNAPPPPPQQQQHSPSAPPESQEQNLLTVPGAIIHLIDKNYSVELACGDFSIIQLRQGENIIAVFARVADEIQWPLAKDEAAVKLDDSHYFFSFCDPKDDDDDANEMLNYGLTFASKGQDVEKLKAFDRLLEHYSSFTVQKVEEKKGVLDISMTKELSPADLKSEKKREVMEERCRAYWTTLAPNVEDYSGTAAKLIAKGSGQLIKGILWCGDVTVDRLNRGNEVLKNRMAPGSNAEISPETLKRIKRVKKVSKMTEKVAVGVLSGAVKVSGFFTSSVANSKVGKKFFDLLPGEMVLASLDGFSKVCDAVEVAGKNVMSTSSTVTTGLVSHRYGEEAAKATNEGMDAAGHVIGAAWAVFKIRQALNPKSVLKPTSLAKSAAKTASKLKAKKK